MMICGTATFATKPSRMPPATAPWKGLCVGKSVESVPPVTEALPLPSTAMPLPSSASLPPR